MPNRLNYSSTHLSKQRPDFPVTGAFESILNVATGLAGLISVVHRTLRPQMYGVTSGPEDRHRAQSLLEHYGTSAEDYFKLWPHDKAYFFSQSGHGGLAYAVHSGTAFSVGGVFGNPEKTAQVLTEFAAFCDQRHWQIAHVLLDQADLPRYTETSYKVLKLGEEAHVDLANFGTKTVQNKHFRNVHNRFMKAGYTFEVHQPPHDAALLGAVSAVSTDWLRSTHRREWKFVAGHFDYQYLDRTTLYVVKDSRHVTQAFANEIPCFVPGYASIDLMRRLQSAPSGVMDYLITEILLHTAVQGYTHFNLGLAPFSGLNGPSGSTAEKLMHKFYSSPQRLLSLQGLRQFKSKFQPTWQPKYIVYTGGRRQLPRIAFALGRLLEV